VSSLRAAFNWLNALSAQDKIALTVAVVSILVGLVSLSQARSARRQVKIAIKQTEAANEQARQAKRQGDLTEQQIELLKEQLSSGEQSSHPPTAGPVCTLRSFWISIQASC
jgi:rRNA maturation endonuclease Nob1